MASPSSADSRLAIVPFVGNPEQKNDEDLTQRKEWPTINIYLKKATVESKELSFEDKHAPAAGLFFKLPNDSLKDVFVTSMQLPAEEQNQFSKKRLRNVQLSRPINFILPDDTFETVKKMNEEAQVDGSVKQFSLRERLEGWEIEKREREANGRVDKYYFHKKSGKRFRSFLEVDSFIVHENTSQKRSLGSISRGQKRDLEGSSSNHDPQTQVKKFLQESFNNLIKLQTKGHLIPPTHADEVKIKKFLKQAHRNLLNKFRAQKAQILSDDETESDGEGETDQMNMEEDYSQMLAKGSSDVPAQGKKEGQGEPGAGKDRTTELSDENAAMVNELMTDEPLIINELQKVHDEPSVSDVAALKESNKK